MRDTSTAPLFICPAHFGQPACGQADTANHTRIAGRPGVWPATVLAAMLGLGCALGSLPASAQAPAAAANDTFELEFWKSTERIGTPGAYQSYLNRFPNGIFAPLAREALQRGNAGAPAAPAAPAARQAPVGSVAPAAPSPATATPTAGNAAPVAAGAMAAAAPAARVKLPLTYFNDQASSSAITFGLGDRFNGPGPVRVGWGKSNKQLPLPSGEWIALAATDHDERNVTSMAPTVSVGRSYAANALVPGSIKLTTVAFGKFDGNQLATLMLVMLNRTQMVAQMTSPEGDACDNGKDARLFEFKEGPYYRRMCGLALAIDNPLANTTQVGTADLLQDVSNSLKRLGATVKGPGIATTVIFTGKTDGWMRLQRIDFPAVHPELEALGARQWDAAAKAAPGDRQPSTVYLRQLRSWLDGYLIRAMAGWRRDLEEYDLEPGTPARSSPTLPDFAPRF